VPEVSRGGVRIHYEVAGHGQPVLLLMGLGVPARGWLPQIEGLQSGYRLLLPDNRGCGQSDAPPGPYSMSQFADDARAVLDAEGVASAHVVGISMGGMIAQRLALDTPQRVRSLALLATHAGGPTAIPTAKALTIFRRLGTGPTAQERFDLMGELLYSPAFFRQHRETLRHSMRDPALARQMTPAAWRAQVSAITGHLTLHQLGRLAHLPALIATGTDDLAVRPINSRFLGAALPRARRVQWAGVGHGCNVEAAEQVNEELRRLFVSAPT